MTSTQMIISLRYHFCFSAKGLVFPAQRLTKDGGLVESFISALLGLSVGKEFETFLGNLGTRPNSGT